MDKQVNDKRRRLTDEELFAFLKALRELQDAMEGEAEKAGLYTEDDIMQVIREIRYGDNA